MEATWKGRRTKPELRTLLAPHTQLLSTSSSSLSPSSNHDRFSRRRRPPAMLGACSPFLSSSAPRRAQGWRHRLGRLRDPAPAAAGGRRRMLVTVTVVGSAGPIRFVVGEEEPVAAVIGTALRCYAREGRFPALGCDVGEFHLFCARSYYMEPLDHAEPIGAHGAREFTLCKKRLPQATFGVPPAPVAAARG
ncbi:hypothetical protein Taro_032719 [Colocasia esculenta]|uniref:DUF7054 domain-containing protein n=1 Tax=Colocasia esculenta TaxID=4460 RepID=A0A843VS12_COLES|nr:hypothetical protein [Colocasia esculenta]